MNQYKIRTSTIIWKIAWNATFYLCYTLRLQLWCPNHAFLIRVQVEVTDRRHTAFLTPYYSESLSHYPTGCINQYTSISAGRKADNSLLNFYQAISGEELRCQGQPGRHLPTVQSWNKSLPCGFLWPFQKDFCEMWYQIGVRKAANQEFLRNKEVF